MSWQLTGGVLKTTVLLVEDSKFQKIANERMLQRAGYTGTDAPDGEQALKAAREAVPDIVLLDMLLPKLGGREVMLALRADPPHGSDPVLFLSSLSQANESKLTEEGAAGYFAKSRLAERPAAAEKELIQLIDKLVQSARAASAKPGPLKAAAGTT